MPSSFETREDVLIRQPADVSFGGCSREGYLVSLRQLADFVSVALSSPKRFHAWDVILRRPPRLLLSGLSSTYM